MICATCGGVAYKKVREPDEVKGDDSKNEDGVRDEDLVANSNSSGNCYMALNWDC